MISLELKVKHMVSEIFLTLHLMSGINLNIKKISSIDIGLKTYLFELTFSTSSFHLFVFITFLFYDVLFLFYCIFFTLWKIYGNILDHWTINKLLLLL